MKVYHRPDIDYVSIDFSEIPEAKAIYENGVIVRYDKNGHIVGVDITDSTKFFLSSGDLNLKEACTILEVSESTLRRMIKAKKIIARKPNGKDYRFKKADIVKLKLGS